MEKKTIHLVNSDAIEDYLKKFCNGDQRLEFLLTTALVKVIKKTPECMEKLPALPDSAPVWLSQAWHSQPEWHQFSPRKNIRLAGSIKQTIDWLHQAIAHDVAWLRNVDDQGRPRKLLNISDFKQIWDFYDEDKKKIIEEARRQGREVLKDETEGGEFLNVMEFTDGYKFVRLLTTRALDREFAFLEHCIGDGDYDDCLKARTLIYYSLRTADNIPRVTITIDPYTRGVHYMASKRNKLPDPKYLGHIASLCLELKVDITAYFSKAKEEYKMPVVSKSAFFDINPSPPEGDVESLEFKNKEEKIKIADDLKIYDLHISDISCLKKFPKNLHVTGTMYLYGKGFPKHPPEGLIVDGHIHTGVDLFTTVEEFMAKHYPQTRRLH